jgi:hypothetical protein
MFSIIYKATFSMCTMFKSWQGERDFHLLQSVQNGYGAHPASYSMENRGLFPMGKVARASTWPHLHSVLQLRMGGAILPFPHTPWWRVKDKCMFTCLLLTDDVPIHTENNSSGSTVTRLWVAKLKNHKFNSQQGKKDFSLLARIQTDSRVHPASYSNSISCSFPGR